MGREETPSPEQGDKMTRLILVDMMNDEFNH
jgi:hypothetical protein